MPARLEAKIIAITGGCSGIGLAVAKQCALSGAGRIFIGDLNAGEPACISEIREQFQRLCLDKKFDELVTISKVDVSDHTSVDRWIQSILEQAGGLDMAANIAGLAQSAYSRPSPSVLHEDFDEWARILDVNLTGVFYCNKAEIRAMMLVRPAECPSLEKTEHSCAGSEAASTSTTRDSVVRRCSIVNMASLTACNPLADIYAYGSSKAAVSHFTSSVARDVWKHGIRVNAVSPAATDTPMMSVFLPGNNASVDRSSLNLLSADDVAEVIVWLLSDEAKLISGTNLQIGFRDI